MKPQHICKRGLDTMRGGHCPRCLIEESAKRAKEERMVSYEGDNFRFVSWGGIEELKLWAKRP